MATVLPTRDRFSGLRALGMGAIQGMQRNDLLGNLTPEQQQASQGLPLSALTQLVTGMAQNEFLSPLQKALQTNKILSTNMQTEAMQNFNNLGVPIGQASPQQLQGLSRLGLINQPVRGTEFEENIKGFTPQDRQRARRIRAGIEPRATKSSNRKISFDRFFGLDEDDQPVFDTVSDLVPPEHEVDALRIGQSRGTIDPEQIFDLYTKQLSSEEGFDETTRVDQGEFFSLIPDIAKASVIKGKNPVDQIEQMFKKWSEGTVEDEGRGGLNLADTVKLSDISPVPSKADQDLIILNSAIDLIEDPDLIDKINKSYGEGTPEGISDALKILRGAFSTEKKRPIRNK